MAAMAAVVVTCLRRRTATALVGVMVMAVARSHEAAGGGRHGAEKHRGKQERGDSLHDPERSQSSREEV